MFRLITLYFWFTFAYGSKKPNILLIVADDQGLGDIGYTDSLFYSPTIDKLALEGLIMNRMYAATTCSPTRASLLTGKYVNKIGMQDGALVPGENRTLSRKFTLLPEVLRGQGYRTVGVGKWHLGMNTVKDLPTARGFDDWFGNLQGEEDSYTHQVGLDCNCDNPQDPDIFPSSWGSNCYAINGFDLNDNGRPAIEYSTKEPTYYPDLLMSKAVEMIENHSNNSHPLFMYLAPTTPHAPLQAPQKYIQLCQNVSSNNYDIRDDLRMMVCAMVAAMDNIVAQVLDALKKKNMLDDTIIFYLSDNGGVTMFGSSNLEYNGQKGSFFEGGVRVPSFVSGKLITQSKLSGSTSNAIAHVTDIYATICTIAGCDKTTLAESDGKSFLTESGTSFNDEFYRWIVPLGATGSYMGNSSGIVYVVDNITWKYTVFPNALSFYGAYEAPQQGTFLFNLDADPFEENNLYELYYSDDFITDDLEPYIDIYEYLDSKSYTSDSYYRSYYYSNQNDGDDDINYYEFYLNYEYISIITNIGESLTKEMHRGGMQSPLDVQGCGWINNKPTNNGCWLPFDSEFKDVECDLSVFPYEDECLMTMEEALKSAGFST